MPLWLKIVLCIVAAEILGGLGGYITASSIGSWYVNLERPPGTPPNAVFGPVWSALYAMIGTSLALIWHRAPAGPAKRGALVAFFIQLALNLAWTPVFFGAHQLAAALVVIVLMILAIVVTIVRFRPLDPLAAGLLVPYLLWVCYATYLNAGFMVLNR
ncbi:tryptophan-rich sensory protein [Luteolibacter flavescens]|uniref:Tryptophan-rich sensory protein n=1 Tax=Luteolibacter flavescens TaxID=1859460 RepID=A0ABT3FNG5_9BACT|nr:TspO/MBR family protein [Luteolibacter flavescens]MCW1885107.1 tryptophan-rich sensory protein [Luteolibacter flavescens]